MPLLDADPSTLISLSHVGFERSGRTILSDISFSVRSGDFFAITGPNGGGKTTLMRLMLRLLKPSSGKITYTDPDIRIGYLPQKSSVDSRFPITVTQTVASGLLSTPGLSAQQREQRIQEALNRVELTDHARKPFGALSGGQQQRALLARAIISRPQLLVLDEPLSYIDRQFEDKIYSILNAMRESTTILMVSHQVNVIAAMANRHLIIDRSLTICSSAKHFVSLR